MCSPLFLTSPLACLPDLTQDPDSYRERQAKQRDTLNSLSSITSYMAREHPELAPDLMPITEAINAQEARVSAGAGVGGKAI